MESLGESIQRRTSVYGFAHFGFGDAHKFLTQKRVALVRSLIWLLMSLRSLWESVPWSGMDAY
jgi:hypothetical protein